LRFLPSEKAQFSTECGIVPCFRVCAAILRLEQGGGCVLFLDRLFCLHIIENGFQYQKERL
jgi:hypothetical protein